MRTRWGNRKIVNVAQFIFYFQVTFSLSLPSPLLKLPNVLHGEQSEISLRRYHHNSLGDLLHFFSNYYYFIFIYVFSFLFRFCFFFFFVLFLFFWLFSSVSLFVFVLLLLFIFVFEMKKMKATKKCIVNSISSSVSNK